MARYQSPYKPIDCKMKTHFIIQDSKKSKKHNQKDKENHGRQL